MDIDFDQLKIGLQLFKESIGLIKDVKDTLPESPQKEAASKSLIAAEAATQIAEANIAKAFGYPLCHCSFPPGIMISFFHGERQDGYKCSKCNKKYLVRGKNTGKIVLIDYPQESGED